MGMFDNYKIKKSIATLLSSGNASTSEVAQARDRLQQIGSPAVPPLIEVLGQIGNQEPIVTLLVDLIDNETLPLFSATLNKPSSRIAKGVVEVLSRSDRYDPNRLLNLFTNPKVSRGHLERILVQRKSQLQAEALLRVLATTAEADRRLIFGLLKHVATKEVVPELIHRLRTEDWTVRFHITCILTRFRTSAVRDTLVRLLSDPHNKVRHAALEGLAAMNVSFDMGPLCVLLRDPDEAIKRKALRVAAVALAEGDHATRKHVVQGLTALGDTQVIRALLSNMSGKEWSCTQPVLRTLGLHSDVTIAQTVLCLLNDPDSFVKRCALEMLQAMKDDRAVKTLVEALKDEEIREPAVEALAASGDKRSVPVFLRMLGLDSETALIAIRILVALGGSQIIHPLLVQLQNPDVSVRREVLRALAVLTNESHAPDVMQAIMAVRDSGEADLRELANQMATTIIKRFGQKVMPRSLLVETAETDARSAQYEVSGAVTVVSQTSADSSAQSAIAIQERDTGAMLDVTTLEPGVVLGNRYRVINRVGEGGFSTVFLVTDMMINEDVILKILSPQGTLDKSTIQRFVQELRYARMVTHENVIRIHDFIAFGKSHAISMEYFPGHNLADELDKGVSISLGRGLKIIWDVCRGVAAAHQVNIVHRDLKPANILINDQDMVKIVDFGVAAVATDINTRITRVGTLLGTPSYMAPEQVRCQAVDARADIYSLGIIMYEIFTGQKPYNGDMMSVLFQHVEGKPTAPREINPSLPRALEKIILQAMAVEPDARFENIDALRRSLVSFSGQKT